MILHGVYIMGIMKYILVGSYSSVYVPPPVCVFPFHYNVYPCFHSYCISE